MALKYYPFYNVEEAVGPGAINQSDDVMLVQFLLREIAKDPSVAPDTRPSKPITVVDGVYSDSLGEWILWYQNTLNAKAPGGILADGRVDPARGMTNHPKFFKSTISHTQYTIVGLNASYRARFKTSHNALETDDNVPQALRSKFAGQDYA